MKPEQGRNQAATQVKGLSPEITLSEKPTSLTIGGRQQDIETDRGKVSILLAGSETVAWDQEDELGTWETQGVGLMDGPRSNKL